MQLLARNSSLRHMSRPLVRSEELGSVCAPTILQPASLGARLPKRPGCQRQRPLLLAFGLKSLLYPRICLNNPLPHVLGRPLIQALTLVHHSTPWKYKGNREQDVYMCTKMCVCVCVIIYIYTYCTYIHTQHVVISQNRWRQAAACNF